MTYLLQTDDEILNPIKKKLKWQAERIERLLHQVKELEEKIEDRNWKDKEVASLIKEADEAKANLRRGFSITKGQEEMISEWIKQHEEDKHKPSAGVRWHPRGGAIGGSYTYEFTPTSIGVFGSIKCSCGERFAFQEEF